MRYRLLVAENSPRRVERLKTILSAPDYSLEVVSDQATAFELSTTDGFDLILIARMLPPTTGFDLCTDLRRENPLLPIFVLGDRTWASDRLAAFKAGADDYMNSPFAVEELRARVERLLRRFSLERVDSMRSYAFGNLRVNFESSEILSSCDRRALSDLENRLLRYFAENSGKVLSRSILLRHVWRYRAVPLTRTVDVHIARLRQKIEEDPKHPRFIVTVHGSGYRFDG
jgi:two-component system alkaline phosphatase synthesis response regulator PhoP